MTLTRVQRIALWIIAVAAMATAFSLLIWVGLPKRSDYSGFVIEDVGYVAPEINQIAPPIIADTFSGDSIQLADLAGESVVINFWATWCAPCAIEMPELQALYEEIDIRILGINIAEPENMIAAWVEQHQLTFDILLDPQQTIYSQYRVIGQPTTFVVAPDGIISHIFYGPVTANDLRAAIDTHQMNG